MGYTDGDGDGWLDRLDGTGPLTLSWEAGENGRGSSTGHVVAEMVVADWEAIGVKMNLDLIGTWLPVPYREGKAYLAGPQADSYGHSPWTVDWSHSFMPMYKDRGPSPLSGAYFYTGGEEGWAPSGGNADFTDVYGNQAPAGTYPSDILGDWVIMQDMLREGKQLPESDPRRIEMGKEIFKLNIKGHYHINTVGFHAQIGYVRNNVRNWHRDGTTAGYGHNNELHFFEDGIDNVSHPGNRSKRYKSWSFALQ
jgi:ABC-type transport system substrate-binding protein